MLFNKSCSFLESDKERSLYCKIFLGCIFNELIPKNTLAIKFIEKIKERYIKTCREFGVTIDESVSNNLKDLESDFETGKLNVSILLIIICIE